MRSFCYQEARVLEGGERAPRKGEKESAVPWREKLGGNGMKWLKTS